MLKRLFRRRRQPATGLTAGERAGALFDSGMNCAQSVLQATIGVDDPQLLEVCDAFGGGIGGRQCLCGAVSGGVIALGLKGKKKLAGKLVDNFRARHKVTCCKGLSAPFGWLSDQHLANCRHLTVAAADDVAVLLGK